MHSTQTILVKIEQSLQQQAIVEWEIDVQDYSDWLGDMSDDSDNLHEHIVTQLRYQEIVDTNARKARDWQVIDSDTRLIEIEQ